MLTSDPAKLLDEVEGALRERTRRLAARNGLLRRYHTPWYADGAEDPLHQREYDRENLSFDYVAHMLPQLVFSNPIVDVESRRGDSVGDAVTSSYKHGLRQWIVDSKYQDVMESLAIDYLMPGGMSAMITPVRNPHFYVDTAWDETPEWPQIVRISPADFFRDPLALSKREARYEGHRWLIDKDDLLQRAQSENEADLHPWGKWDLEALEGLDAGGDALDDYHATRKRAETIGLVDRNQVVLYTLWVPEYTEEGWPGPEDGFHGAEFTLAPHSTSGGVFLRAPRPFFGPRWGPYEATATYPVPDDPYDLAVLVASEGPVREANVHARATSLASARYKRLIVVGPSVSDEMVHALVNSEHDYVLRDPGMGQYEVRTVELGGATQQMLDQLMIAKDRAERSLGIDDARVGRTAGRATATEVAVADTSSRVRVDYVKQVWYRANARILTTVAWYMWHSRAMRWPIGPEILEDLGPQAVERMSGWPIEVVQDALASGALALEFQGGDGVAPEGGEAARTGIRFDDLQILITPHSMERISDSARHSKAVLRLNTLGTLVPMMVQAPFIDWGKELERIGDALGLEGLGASFDLDAFADYMALVQRIQTAQMSAPPSPARSGFRGPAAPSDGPAPADPGTVWGGQSVRRSAELKQPSAREGALTTAPLA